MVNEKSKENRKGLILFLSLSLFLAGCLLLIKLQPWGTFSGYGSSANKEDIIQQSSIIEISQASSSDPLYEQFGPLKDIRIRLHFGTEVEQLTIDHIADWITVDKTDDVYTYTVSETALYEYSKSLADRYSNFEAYISFLSADGTEKSAVNNSIGWIFDEAYAAEQLKQFILNNQSVDLVLTDRSTESNRWWQRVSADYDAAEKKGDCYAEVSIDKQYMWVHKNGKIILESPVVTGKPSSGYDTPTGAFIVFTKQEHASLYGPGYETEVDYWIAFSYAIGFHDAYWQDEFGGDVYLTDGSHGCVNMPHEAVEQLYSIAYINMPVYVY